MAKELVYFIRLTDFRGILKTQNTEGVIEKFSLHLHNL